MPLLFQNGGSNLCAVDDSNDHVLSVWDWQREERLADVKVSLHTSCWAVLEPPCLDPPPSSRLLGPFPASEPASGLPIPDVAPGHDASPENPPQPHLPSQGAIPSPGGVPSSRHDICKVVFFLILQPLPF